METELIDLFNGKYAFLSNFYECSVTYDNLTYGSSESAYQAQKTEDVEERKEFVNLTPREAKKKGRKVNLREDWEDVKDDVMYGVVYSKFTQNKDLGKQLVATYPKRLVEGNTWHDTYWGLDYNTREGENHLGKILMRVREELMLKDIK